MCSKLNKFMNNFEKVIIMSLMGLMSLVIALATIELAWVMAKDILSPPLFLLEIEELLEIFGLFLLVLIGVELLETIQTYHEKRQVRVEVVVLVAMIAIARKIIIIDYKSLTSFTLLDAGGVTLALAVAYWLLKTLATRTSIAKGKAQGEAPEKADRPPSSESGLTNQESHPPDNA
ncbi:MAG: hypothetical protein QG577_193 [Thermodesulfobacteriota bacterium]|nr:hypothetical protein [Thermodesulfobacteriota bacterium]